MKSITITHIWIVVITIAVVLLAVSNFVLVKEIKELRDTDRDLYQMHYQMAASIIASESVEKMHIDTFINNAENSALRGAQTATQPPEELTYLGNFTITHYCHENYPHICNDGDPTQTASGAIATVGRTVGIDPRVIPYGTRLLIDGHEYVAEDTGGGIGGNHIDILVEYHQEALDLGKHKADVYMINE